jgi:hypothetical protein
MTIVASGSKIRQQEYAEAKQQCPDLQSGDREGGRVATQLRSVVSIAGSDPIAAIRTGSPVTGVAASPDGGSVAVSCGDGVLRIYSVATQRLTGGFKVCLTSCMFCYLGFMVAPNGFAMPHLGSFVCTKQRGCIRGSTQPAKALQRQTFPTPSQQRTKSGRGACAAAEPSRGPWPHT